MHSKAIVHVQAWLHQKQRVVKQEKGMRFLYAEPCDLLFVLEVCAEFFDLTYAGIESCKTRKDVMDIMVELWDIAQERTKKKGIA